MTLAADGVLSGATFRGFSPAEPGFRWSGGEAAIVFPGPGPGVSARVEVTLAAWRPRGQPPPLVTMEVGGHAVSDRPPPGKRVLVLETVTSGAWDSDLTVRLRSDTFRPGPGDPRELGVRVEEARLVPLGGVVRRPPLRAPVLAAASAAALFALVRGAGAAPGAAQAAGLAWGVLLGLLYAFARPWAALSAGPILLALVVSLALVRIAPRKARFAAGVGAGAVRALAAGLRRLSDLRVAALLVWSALAVTAAYRASPRIDIDVGSGREVAVARGMGPYDAVDGTTFRTAPRGALLDLTDFGGGTSWRIEATAAVSGRPRTATVLRAGGHEAVAEPGPETWRRAVVTAPAPFGWRSGLVLTVPGSPGALRLDRVVVDRGRALPSLRVALIVAGCALLPVVLFGAAGLPQRAGLAAGAILVLGVASALAADPLVAIPFAPRFLAILGAATALAACVAALLGRLQASGVNLGLTPAAVAAAAAGFAAWLAATAFPLYRGGHFYFHSSIAEEIWKGRFLIYYLPYPGSMLSEQAHWGNIKVPHPALYQTLAAPLAALPGPWFALSEKAFLAGMFAALVLVAAMLAARVAGPAAASFAALAAATLVPTFQLLGLGHLMTILGVFASSLALAWISVRPDLRPRRTLWVAVLLLTFCFLSYFASLLFTGLALVLLIAASLRDDGAQARRLLGVLAGACLLAFLLYYVHWAWPFLSESIPHIAGGAGREPAPLLERLARQPFKLMYSFGGSPEAWPAVLIPLVGLGTLLTLRRSWERRVLLCWALVFVIVTGMDLFFNFILKHHYFVIVPVAVGLGVLLGRLWSSSRAGRVVAGALVAAKITLAVYTATLVAMGRYPYHLGH